MANPDLSLIWSAGVTYVNILLDFVSSLICTWQMCVSVVGKILLLAAVLGSEFIRCINEGTGTVECLN